MVHLAPGDKGKIIKTIHIVFFESCTRPGAQVLFLRELLREDKKRLFIAYVNKLFSGKKSHYSASRMTRSVTKWTDF